MVRSGTCTVTRLVWSTSIPCASNMFNSLSSLYGVSHVFSCIGHAQGHYAWLFSIMDDPARRHAERVPSPCYHVRHLQANILRPGDRLSCALCERPYDGRPYLKERSCVWRIPINKVLLYRCAKCRVLLCFHCWTHHFLVCVGLSTDPMVLFTTNLALSGVSTRARRLALAYTTGTEQLHI